MVEIITNLGLPIAEVCGCAYFIYTTNQQQREDNNKREEKLFAQLEKFGDSLDSFNTTLIKIDARLEEIEKKVSEEKNDFFEKITTKILKTDYINYVNKN